MNEYEIHGRLYEISLILDCDVLDLIFIKKQIDKDGFNADDKRQLRDLGLRVNYETFEECIKDFNDQFGIMSTNIINSNSYQAKRKGLALYNALKDKMK
ncbi:hypothetical protein [Chryseobacterium lathyri]|uniref:hypothetical protein n=1 Tax=Chryseobacterium lathyri TaxID=395933 RepID=UPI001CBB998D|nr:hypothetical protein [Chryseobacterium lathyri]